MESPDGAQLSPGLAISSIRASNSLADRSNHSLQGMALAADDRNTVRVFPNMYTYDTSWASCMDWDGQHNSGTISAPDISDAHDSSMFSWPASTRSTGSELDMSNPFTVEHTGSSKAMSSTLSDLDLAPFFDGHTQGHDITKSWGEPMSYLIFDEKVGARTLPSVCVMAIRHANTIRKFSEENSLGKGIILEVQR